MKRLCGYCIGFDMNKVTINKNIPNQSKSQNNTILQTTQSRLNMKEDV